MRGILLKCDPRKQSDEAMRTAPNVEPRVSVVSLKRIEITCASTPESAWTVIVDRRGLTEWKITRIDIPGDILS